MKYFAFELIHGSEDKISHKFFLEFREYFHILDDGLIDSFHLINDDFLYLSKRLGLIAHFACHMVGLQVEGILAHLCLYLFVLSAYPFDYLAVIII